MVEDEEEVVTNNYSYSYYYHNRTDLVGSMLWFQVMCLGSKYQVYAGPVW